MIQFEGRINIFDSDCQTLLCPINVVGAMGKGLALEFRHRVPGLYDFYLSHFPKNNISDMHRRSNKLLTFPFPDGSGKKVLLFPTKHHWKFDSPPGLLRRNLQSLVSRHSFMGITSLAIPAIGCGEGHLDYQSYVRPLIYEILDPIELPVKICLL